MKSVIKRYQIPIFFVLTLLIGWLPWYTGSGGLIIATPTLAGLIVAFLAEGKDGLRDVLRRIVRWYLLVLLLPALASLVAVGVYVLFGGTAPQFPLLRQNQHMILLTFVFYLLPWQSSAFLEEVRLRGYAQESVQKRWGDCVSTPGSFSQRSGGRWLWPGFTTRRARAL
jgi:membrane protease YdiL (CAAX protease family)